MMYNYIDQVDNSNYSSPGLTCYVFVVQAGLPLLGHVSTLAAAVTVSSCRDTCQRAVRC